MLLALLLAAATSHAPAPIAAVSRGDWTLTLDGSEVANLAYQLDCLGGVAKHCSHQAFSDLWHAKLGWSPADDAALSRWTAVHRRYGHSFALEPSAEDAPFPTTPRMLDFEQNLRAATLQAPDIQALAHDLSLLLEPGDAETLLRVLDHFGPRFHPWFAQHGRPQLDVFARQFAALLREKKLIDFVGTAADFYGVPKGPHAVHIHLVAHPLAKSNTNGEQLGEDAVVECLQGESPEHRIDVVLHEAFHFMYRSAPGARQALSAAFLASKDPSALAAFGLLDEVLATTLGNGLIPKKLLSPAAFATYVSDPQRLYSDPFIGPVAKAMIPVVEARLQRDQPLDARFVAQYLSAAHQALGDKIKSPMLALRTMSLAWDGKALAGAAQALMRAVSPRSAWRSSPLDDERSFAELTNHARLDGAVLVLGSKLSDLSRWRSVLGPDALSALQARAKKEPSFVQVIQRPTGAKVWVLVAADAEAMDALVAQFTK